MTTMIQLPIIVDDKFVYVNYDLLGELDKACFVAGTNQAAEGAIIVNSKRNMIKYSSLGRKGLQVVEREITPNLQAYIANGIERR